MPTYETKESSNIPEGEIVAAKVSKIEEKPEWEFPALAFQFEVTEGEWEGWNINDNASPKFTISPPSKLYQWAIVLLNRTFEVGESFNTDDLLGMPCRIEIGWKPDKELDEDGNPARYWMRVETMLPPRGAVAASAGEVFG